MACDNQDALTTQIVNSATGPLIVKGDAGEVTQRSTQDLIAAANYLAGLCAAKTRRLGIRYTRLIPDGTVRTRYCSPRWRDGGGTGW